MLKKRVNLFGVFIDDFDIDVAVALARASLCGGKARIFFTPNLEMLDAARKNADIKKLLNLSSINLCDGIGVILASKIIGKPIEHKIAGIDFGEKLLELAQKVGARVFLLGGEEGVAERARAKLRIKLPNLDICGTHHGYFDELKNDDVCHFINQSRADILLVCRGFPLQEKFVIDNRKSLQNIKVFACLGGSLDVWSGEKQRAPECIRNLNLEWMWRIANEPYRIKDFLASISTLFYALWN